MGRFITYCILLLVAIGSSLYYLYQYHQPFPSYYINKIKYKTDAYDVIVLGTSHAWSFDHNINELKGEHFNKAGNTIYYDYQNYKYLKERNRLNPNALIILPLSYFSLGANENRSDRGYNNSFINDFYAYLPASSIHDYNLSKESQLRMDRIRENAIIWIQDWLPKEKTPVPPPKQSQSQPKVNMDTTRTTTAAVVPSIDSIRLSERKSKYLKEHAAIRFKDHIETITPGSSEQNMQYLSEMIEDIQSNGFRIILVTAPFHAEYNTLFDEVWLSEHFHRHIKDITEQHQVEYLNYASKSELQFNADYFKDSDHLSDEGIAYFNKYIFQEDLRKLKLID